MKCLLLAQQAVRKADKVNAIQATTDLKTQYSSTREDTPHGNPVDAFEYVEYAYGGVNRRNHVGRVDELSVPPRAGCYTSALRFTEALATYRDTNMNPKSGKPSVAGYLGIAYAPFLYIDFDHEADPSLAIAEAQQFIQWLDETYDVSFEALRVYWSGNKGISIEIPGTLFGGFEPEMNDALTARFRAIVTEWKRLFPTLDNGIYERVRLWRIPNTRHEKSGLFKIPLTVTDIRAGFSHICNIAKQPRQFDYVPDDEWDARPDLMQLWQSTKGVRPTSAAQKTSDPDERIPEGQRNIMLTSIAGTMRRRGLTADEIAPSLLAVNAFRCDPPLEDVEVWAIAHSVQRYTPADPVFGHYPGAHDPEQVNVAGMELKGFPDFSEREDTITKLRASLIFERDQHKEERHRWLAEKGAINRLLLDGTIKPRDKVITFDLAYRIPNALEANRKKPRATDPRVANLEVKGFARILLEGPTGVAGTTNVGAQTIGDAIMVYKKLGILDRDLHKVPAGKKAGARSQVFLRMDTDPVRNLRRFQQTLHRGEPKGRKSGTGRRRPATAIEHEQHSESNLLVPEQVILVEGGEAPAERESQVAQTQQCSSWVISQQFVRDQ